MLIYIPPQWRTGPVSLRGGGGGRADEVSCQNIFSIAFPKVKWFCPNITSFIAPKPSLKMQAPPPRMTNAPPLPLASSATHCRFRIDSINLLFFRLSFPYALYTYNGSLLLFNIQRLTYAFIINTDWLIKLCRPTLQLCMSYYVILHTCTYIFIYLFIT